MPLQFTIGLAGSESLSSSSSDGGRKWLSTAAMTVDGGVAVGLCLCFITYAVKSQ